MVTTGTLCRDGRMLPSLFIAFFVCTVVAVEVAPKVPSFLKWLVIPYSIIWCVYPAKLLLFPRAIVRCDANVLTIYDVSTRRPHLFNKSEIQGVSCETIIVHGDGIGLQPYLHIMSGGRRHSFRICWINVRLPILVKKINEWRLSS